MKKPLNVSASNISGLFTQMLDDHQSAMEIQHFRTLVIYIYIHTQKILVKEMQHFSCTTTTDLLLPHSVIRGNYINVSLLAISLTSEMC